MERCELLYSWEKCIARGVILLYSHCRCIGAGGSAELDACGINDNSETREKLLCDGDLGAWGPKMRPGSVSSGKKSFPAAWLGEFLSMFLVVALVQAGGHGVTWSGSSLPPGLTSGVPGSPATVGPASCLPPYPLPSKVFPEIYAF